MILKVRLREALHDRNMTQKDLAHVAGIREATISAIARNKQDQVNLRHLEKIMDALNIADIRELIEAEEGKK